MPVERMKRFLDDNRIAYRCTPHSTTYRAMDTAAAAGVPPYRVAKAVIVMINHSPVMVVIPTDTTVNLTRLGEAASAYAAWLAPEQELALCFPDCQAGAVPPLGNLWGLRVYADESLAANDRIAFNAGTHEELLEMSWSDFVELAQPRIGCFADPIGASAESSGSLPKHAATRSGAHERRA